MLQTRFTRDYQIWSLQSSSWTAFLMHTCRTLLSIIFMVRNSFDIQYVKVNMFIDVCCYWQQSADLLQSNFNCNKYISWCMFMTSICFDFFFWSQTTRFRARITDWKLPTRDNIHFSKPAFAKYDLITCCEINSNYSNPWRPENALGLAVRNSWPLQLKYYLVMPAGQRPLFRLCQAKWTGSLTQNNIIYSK